MYGLLIENLASFIRVQWGEGKWDSVRKHAGVDAPSFSIHHVYAETLLQRLARSAVQILGVDERQFFEAMGVYFVEYVGHYGYDKMLLVLGRHLRDFLNGLDNLHEYLKFSYTKMRAPSFYCDSETANGLRLHYRSKRRGFVWYTMGQIKQVAKHFYEQDIEIELVSEELDGETMHNIFQLTFDNQAFVEHEALTNIMKKESALPIKAALIFDLFPFCIVFSTEMVITYTGHALLTILKDLVGQCMTEAFEIIRPLIAFSFNTILERRNNIFELVTTSPIKEESMDQIMEDEEAEGVHLKLRGQMMMMEEWNMMLFLANPVMPDLESLVSAGIFINDLSLHDCSRDLVLAGTQQSVELKLALDQEQHKSKKLEESMKKLDDEMKRTDELLYQMIPKKVADRLRQGENPAATCEVFESVSVLFSDVVTFTDICSKITPMQVVSMLNHMYSLFDQLTERNGVYKVETIGDSYMVVCGAPTPDASHTERIADMGMDMVDAMQAVKNPSKEGEHLKIRVGCHSGMVVAGVVGVKMPRYCLFGDCVNSASRMESTSEGGRIQVSEAFKSRLPATYKVELRGTVSVKGKGEMNTYWLLERDSRVPLSKVHAGSFDWTEPGTEKRRSSRSDKGRKGSVISNTDTAETAKSRDPSASPSPQPSKSPAAPPKAPEPSQPSTSKAVTVTSPKMPPPIIKTPDSEPSPPPTVTRYTNNAANLSPTQPAPPKETVESPTDAKPKAPPQKSESTEQDSSGNALDLNKAGKDLYRSARRLSNAVEVFRSRSPSPTPRRPRPESGKKANEESRPVPTIITTDMSTPKPDKKVTLVRQVTLAELPDKLAQVMDKPAETVNIVRVPANDANINQTGANKSAGEDIICIVPVTNGNPEDNNNPDGPNSNIGTENPDDRESFLINVKMKKAQENGKPNGIRKTINGIAVGISRLPKNEALRKKIRENKVVVVTSDVLADMGCGAFADKQKQVISQACSIL